jgi:hypothetical protein
LPNEKALELETSKHALELQISGKKLIGKISGS